MTIKAAEGVSEYWYTPESEQDEENPTRFKLKPFNEDQKVDVLTGISINENDDVMLNASAIRRSLKYGLVDWEHFEGSGGPIRFGRNNFRLIPWDIQVELAGELIRVSTISEADEKN